MDSLREPASAPTTAYWPCTTRSSTCLWWCQWVQRDPTYRPGILPPTNYHPKWTSFVYMKIKTNTSIVLTTSNFVAFTSRPSPPTLNFGPVCPKFYAYLSQYLHAQQAYTDHNIKRCYCFYANRRCIPTQANKALFIGKKNQHRQNAHCLLGRYDNVPIIKT
jgi:hypothetical protein